MRVVRSVPEDNHADQDEDGGNNIPDKVYPMDALTATKAGVFVIDIKTIPALHVTNQPQHKFLNLLLEITRLFTLKGVPLIGKKNVKSRKNHIIHRPESRHRAIKRKRATDEPTDQPSHNRRGITAAFI